jgi:hypothetical protein
MIFSSVWLVAFDSLKSVDVSMRLDGLRPGNALFGEVPLRDAALCIDQYRTFGLPMAGLNCSLGNEMPGCRTQPRLGENLSGTHRLLAKKRG